MGMQRPWQRRANSLKLQDAALIKNKNKTLDILKFFQPVRRFSKASARQRTKVPII
jgi:hypothetical protein